MLEAQRWVMQSIGLRGSAHFWAMPLYTHFEDRRHDSFFDGLGGDNLSASSFVSRSWTNYLDQGRLPELADALILRSAGKSHDRHNMAPSLWQRFPREAARSIIATELGRHLEYANPVSRFMFFNRMRTLIAPLATVAMGRFSRPFFPFLDEAVFEFLAALPVSYMFDKSFHRDAIARAYGKEWPSSVAVRRPSRMALRRIAHWHEVMSGARLHYSALRRVLQHPARVLNPLRWATFEHQHNAFLSATYMAHLLDLEGGANDSSSLPLLQADVAYP